MDLKTILTFAISALGLLATAMSGVLWVVNENMRYQDQERREVEMRLRRSLEAVMEHSRYRMDRQEDRHMIILKEVLENRERLLRLEASDEGVIDDE